MSRWIWLLALAANAEEFTVQGLREPVEILRDRWGVPHIYARNQEDLFFAQGYMAAYDRLWQIDLWRRQSNGTLAEVLGPDYVERDRVSRLLRFRGDWQKEWPSYAPDTWHIVNAFVRGINAYIQRPGRKRTPEFEALGHDAGLWTPNDVVGRVSVFSMMNNLLREAKRARELDTYGAAALEKWNPPDPFIRLAVPNNLNLKEVILRNLAAFDDAVDPAGSNNWAVSGRLTATGKPLLASDPHRTLQIPSLRRTVHLVAPGWNAIGAGEPALPGISLGHNASIGFGFTITGTDVQDLYVERVKPGDSSSYQYKNEWKRFETETQWIAVKGEAPRSVELRYTVHGPVVGYDAALQRAYVMRWVGSEPGTAGYLGALSLARATDWASFQAALPRFKTPAENIVYADTAGNIGMAVAGLTPRRGNWSGLLPVPGHTGEYEWQGFLNAAELPRVFNPANGRIATANNNVLPAGYKETVQYEWASPLRVRRIEELLAARRGWTASAFEALQLDVVSPAARRMQRIIKSWLPARGSKAASVLPLLNAWDARMSRDSVAASLFAMWMSRVQASLGPAGLHADIDSALKDLESKPRFDVLETTLNATVSEFEKALGPDRSRWRYGNIHFLHMEHSSKQKRLDRGPIPMPGDANTINVAAGPGFRASHGASFRMILDLADWDRSRMTNAPGESGDPDSPYYDNLLADWAEGRYHPMPFTRAAVEAATAVRILLRPAGLQ